MKIEFIRPGKPVENCFIESFNGSFRDECLNKHSLTNLSDARRIIERWRRDYNQVRPRSSLDYLPPKEFIEQTESATGHWAAVASNPAQSWGAGQSSSPSSLRPTSTFSEDGRSNRASSKLACTCPKRRSSRSGLLGPRGAALSSPPQDSQPPDPFASPPSSCRIGASTPDAFPCPGIPSSKSDSGRRPPSERSYTRAPSIHTFSATE